ncbi:MAG: glucose-1-phosphate cytidylyltransferase [Raoultibacter sp.]
MKVVILAGGFGTRISEESHLKPKPMIEVGGRPILWHIMKLYSSFGFNEFVICAGYKQHVIKDYFANYYLYSSDVTFDFARGGKVDTHSNDSEPWKVTVVDTGLNTMTGGRIKRIAPYVGDEPFFLTYGDGVADVDLSALLALHKKQGKIATLTAVQVPQRFGVLDITEDSLVTDFREKDERDAGRINGGFMVLDPKIFNYIENDETVFEQYPLRRVAAEGELSAYSHPGFWKCMDTQRDRYQLEDMWAEGNAPWKVW